jgi:PAS domain S-box-containing protein
MTVARLKTIAYLAIPVLAVGDLGVDIITPLGITDWVWYVIPLLFTIYVGGRSLPFVLAAALSILSMVGFFFSPPGVDPHWALSSRLVGIVVLWLVALMIWHRKQTVAALAGERLLLRRLIDNLPDLVFVKDSQSRFIVTNTACAQQLGASRPEEVLGKSDADFVTPELAAQYRADEQALMQSGQPVHKEERTEHKTLGEMRWSLTTKIPLKDDAGNVVGLMGIARDITERKQADEALLLSKQRLALHVEQTPLAVIQWDSDFKVQEWNPAAEKVFGYTQEEAVGRHFGFFISDSARPQVEAVGLTLIKRGGSQRSTNENITKAGKTIICEWFNTALVDPAGRFMGVASLVQDITERKQAEEALRQTHNELEKRVAERKKAERQLAEALNFNQKIISGATLGMLVYKASGQCVLANEAAARTVNGTVPQLLSQDFRQIVSWRISDLLKIAELALATGKPQQVETHFVSTFGKEIWLEAHFTSFVQGNEPHLLFIFNDITERKKLEAQFLRAQRLESIGTLASGIAHDLNNVLTPLLISVQLLKEKVADEDGRRLLQSLEVNVQRGASLVKQVLAFGRGIEGERVMVYPAHVVREIKQIVHETFPKSVEFELHSPADLWTIIGDPTQLHQVLLNLCVNARDAMPNGGKLSIHMENATFDETYAGMELESKPGPYVAISVADTGTGIPKEIRDKIFDPFFSTKAPGKGTGLGLSTTLAIVKSHGGFIHCHSEPGKGTTFKAYFPANNVPAVVEKLSVEESKLPRGHNELVLVVDDEEPIRILVQKALEHFGYRVLLAADGVEAVSLYRSHQKEIDVVITDIVMPIMDGTTTIAVLKNINPDVRIVTSSGVASEGGMTRARNAGARCFIPKPYTAETMLNTLHEVLSGN